MKRIFAVVAAIFISLAVSVTYAKADLDVFLSDLNMRAKADLPGFSSSLSAQFHVPLPEVRGVMKTVTNPADAFICFQLSLMSGIHIDRVLNAYRMNAPHGWGVIAKELGIKPGSEAFHALKAGEFDFFGARGGKGEAKSDKSQGKGQGKSMDKGKGKGHK